MSDVFPGDIIFCHGTGFLNAMIRAGERLRMRNSEATYWSHVAIVVEPVDGRPRIVQAGSNGVDYAWLSDVDVHYQVVSSDDFPTLLTWTPSRLDIIAQAHALVGAKYGWLTIASIVMNLLTPKWVRFPDFRRGSTYICSAAAAWCLHAGGAKIDTYDIYQIFPSELRALAR